MKKALLVFGFIFSPAFASVKPPVDLCADIQDIGKATMSMDRSITLELDACDPATGKTEGHAIFVYKVEHPQYVYIYNHLAPLHPGDEKRVKPFP